MELSTRSVSDGAAARDFFKYSTLIILLILLFFQVVHLIFKLTIIPEVISLTAAFICVFYLWLTSQKDMQILQVVNLDLLRAHEALRESHINTILSLILIQESKDSYTYGHSERVKKVSVFLAQKLGLSKQEIEVIGRGAKLHDIGKIGIQDEILFTTEHLTPEQFEIMKSHTFKGVTILNPLKFLNEEKLIVRHHHERYDGNGYPDKLKGEAIPLGARIVCVADAFDAMRSKRNYRNSLTKEEAVHRLQANANIQFDPKIVDVLVKNIDSLIFEN